MNHVALVRRRVYRRGLPPCAARAGRVWRWAGIGRRASLEEAPTDETPLCHCGRANRSGLRHVRPHSAPGEFRGVSQAPPIYRVAQAPTRTHSTRGNAEYVRACSRRQADMARRRQVRRRGWKCTINPNGARRGRFSWGRYRQSLQDWTLAGREPWVSTCGGYPGLG